LSKEDTLYQTTAGVAVDWSLSRQNFLLDAAIVDNRFDQNSNLDYVGQTLDLKWNWVVGNDLTGSVGFVQKITQNDFSNTASQETSKKEDGTAQFLAKWRYARDWELGVRLSDYALNYDLQALKINDRKSVKKTVFINYISHSSNWMGVTLLQEDGSYPRRNLSSSSVIDNKFQQNSILLNMNWRVTGKSRLQADVGWNARTHPNISSRDYDGLSVKAVYSWFPTGKTMVDVSLYRQLISSSYRDSSFSESTGYSLGVSWRMSEKVSFSGTIKDELRDYLGQESSFKERYSWITLGASYQLNTMFNVALQFNQSTRDSTQVFRDYGADSFVLSLNLKF
ncbi:hypothetical protein MNBD_GAMMA03-849, partial [hydrothermal vent metagenome]